VIVQNHAFSVNYADCCIRWGLYESAKQFVGWPIVPGFDIAGVVVHAPPGATFRPGDKVFGCTLFGAYSSRIAVPQLQLRKVPAHLTLQEAASIPAVSLTALYALHLAGHYPLPATPKRNRSILIHSAAGGVGSMAIQMAKFLGLTPIVGVVGSSHKVEAALKLGCNYVIDKSKEDSLWDKAREYAPEGGYATILDANGISTLRDSYNNLCPTGRLIVFGFHSNLPLGKDALSPRQWLLMAIRQFCMPTFDAMDMVVANKSVMGFNLSFLSDEREFVSQLWNQIHQWLCSGDLQCPRVVTMDDMQQIGDAHELIMSGQSVGKIVVSTEQPSS
jgi:NADPH:quinone reductase-like Zn-dependent oxidoreductase